MSRQEVSPGLGVEEAEGGGRQGSAARISDNSLHCPFNISFAKDVWARSPVGTASRRGRWWLTLIQGFQILRCTFPLKYLLGGLGKKSRWDWKENRTVVAMDSNSDSSLYCPFNMFFAQDV